MIKAGAKKATEATARFLTEADDPQWEEGLAESNQRTWLQWLPWIRCAGKHLGGCAIIGIERSGRLIGGVAGLTHSSDGQRCFRPIYLTAYHGLWLRDANLRPSHAESLTRIAADALVPFLNMHFDRWAFSSPPELIDIRPFNHFNCNIDVFYTYRLPLTEPEQMRAGFEKDVRRMLRRMEEAGLVFEECTLTDEILAAFRHHMVAVAEREAWGGGTCAPEVFSDVARLVVEAGNGALLFVRTPEGEAAASVLVTWDDRRSYAVLGGGHPEVGKSGAIRYLHWRAFVWAWEKGLPEMDLLGGNLPGLQIYKRQWNPATVPYLSVSRGPRMETRVDHVRQAAKHLVKAVIGES